MKTFVIGDIHGCYDEFERLLEIIQGDFKKDRLILLGDYIDRGEKSLEVVERIINLEEEFGRENIILLKGNHELMAIEYLEGKGSNYMYNGGDHTIREYKRRNRKLLEHIDFFKSLRNYYEDENYIYVHGGLRPGIKLQEQCEYDLVWIREEFYLSSYSNTKGIIFGHTPTTYINSSYYPVNINDNIALDTACVYDGYLSALEIEDGRIMKVHQVKDGGIEGNSFCA